MNRFFLAVSFVLLCTFLSGIPVFAHADRGNIKGQVIAVDPVGTLTVLTSQEKQVMVIVPGGFKTVSFEVGDSVLVTGIYQSDSAILAASIKKVDRIGADPINGDLVDSYCASGKLLKTHPLAVRLSEMYPVTPDWVMAYFCNGHNMGTILLALKMEKQQAAEAGAVLDEYASGKGWEQIWIEVGWIGTEEEAISPPGWLQKP